MKFSLVIYSSPYSSQAGNSALEFAKAVLDSGHTIYRLFFLSDGVHNSSSLVVAAQDEIDIPKSWEALIEQHQLDSVVCVSSAIKRGIVNSHEASRYGLNAASLSDKHSIGGLGQLVDAISQSDRVINFG